MSRSTEEWIAANDDTTVPPRVRVRVFERFNGVCQCGCTRRITVGEAWQVDHIKALINGGENRENNLHPMLTAHHGEKTKADVAEKSDVYEIKLRHLGIRTRSRFPFSRDSGLKRKINGEVVRR